MAQQKKEMRRMSEKLVWLPQALTHKAGNSNFLSVLIQRVHSLRQTLALLLTDSTASAAL